MSVYPRKHAREVSVPRSDSQRKHKSSIMISAVGTDESSCWDGKNLDSPDHQTHVSYPATGTFEKNGACPGTHPVKLPQLMFEIIWDTSSFNDKSLWPADGSQPFVLSMGDRLVFLSSSFTLFRNPDLVGSKHWLWPTR